MTQPDTLHDRLRAEIDRRLAVARAAEAAAPSPWVLGTDQVIDDTDDTVVVAHHDVVAHIALHDPADAIRRYGGELEVLERHAEQHFPPATAAQFGDGPWCLVCRGPGWPCRELKSLASRLGVSVDG